MIISEGGGSIVTILMVEESLEAFLARVAESDFIPPSRIFRGPTFLAA